MSQMLYRSLVTATTKKRIEQLLSGISIAAVSSWLKTKVLAHSASSREGIVARVDKLIETGELTWEDFETGAIELEESSSKTVSIFQLTSEDVGRLRDERGLQARARNMTRACATSPTIVSHPPEAPTLVYLAVSGEGVRAKFAETQKRLEIDLVRQTLKRVPVKKVVVANANFATGILQIRLDSPEKLHSHVDSEGHPRDSLYRSYYLAQTSALFSCNLVPLDLRPILKTLSEKDPRLLELVLNKVRTAHNSKLRITSRADVRDDPDWQAAHTNGGDEWAHEQGAGEWLANSSSGRLSRNLFTDIDAVNGTLRFLADCHDSEIEYAIARVAEFQTRPTTA
jgi:hypothetical protein